MTTEIDAEGLAVARAEVRRALMSGEAGTMGAADVAIRAYLSASRSTSEAEPVAPPIGWPPLIELGKTLAFFASAIKSGEAWSPQCQDAYTKENTALQALYTLPTPASDDQVEAVWEPHGWFIRADQNSEWQFTSYNPENISHLRTWECRRAGMAALAAMGSAKP